MSTPSRCGGIAALLLACSIAAAGAAGAQTRHTFGGKTGQGRTLSFVVSGNRITGLRFSITLKCTDGSGLTDTEQGFAAIPFGAGGRFADVQGGSTDVVRVRGAVTGRTVTGRVRVTDRPVKNVACDSGAVRFTARRR